MDGPGSGMELEEGGREGSGEQEARVMSESLSLSMAGRVRRSRLEM